MFVSGIFHLQWALGLSMFVLEHRFISFKLPSSIPLCGYITFHSIVWHIQCLFFHLMEHFGCLHFWALMNNAVIHKLFLLISCNIVNRAEFIAVFIYLVNIEKYIK